MNERIQKIKTGIKYGVNVLTIANALLLALNEVWHWNWCDEVSGTLLAITSVMSTYLLGQKLTKK